MPDLLDSLSEVARDALRRRQSAIADDLGFLELSRHSAEGFPLALRGDATRGESAWFISIYGLGLAYELRQREQADGAADATLDDAA